MSGVPRDPAFWRRFSTAVHLEAGNPVTRPDLKHSDSWLGRQERKKSRRTCICCAFWLCFAIIVAAVVVTILYLLNKGVL